MLDGEQILISKEGPAFALYTISLFFKRPNTVFLQIPKEFFSVEAETQELKYSVLPLRGKSVIQAF